MGVPFGNNTVTVIERIEARGNDGKTRVSYQLNTLKGCSWKPAKTRNLANREHGDSVRISCRIPANGQRCPCLGDVMILGSVKQVPEDAQEVRKLMDESGMNGAFIVSLVKNNAMAGFPLSHFLVEGE